MNAQNQWMNEEETESGYTVSYGRRDQSREQQMRRHAYERPSARPNSFNGMHRRRNKRFSMQIGLVAVGLLTVKTAEIGAQQSGAHPFPKETDRGTAMQRLRGLKVRVVDERVKTVKCARMREQNKSIDPTGLIRVPLATSERDEHVRRPHELQET